MKKLMIALLALAVSFSAMAQKPAQKGQRPEPRSVEQAPKGQNHERFEAEKVAYITEQLSLSVEEAQAFWPVYNQAQKEQREAFGALREQKKALREALRDGKSDAEVKPLLDSYLKARSEMKDPMVEHRADFVKAVGEAKTAKLYLAEEGFRNKTLKQMAGNGRRQPQGREGAQGPGKNGARKAHGGKAAAE